MKWKCKRQQQQEQHRVRRHDAIRHSEVKIGCIHDTHTHTQNKRKRETITEKAWAHN